MEGNRGRAAKEFKRRLRTTAHNDGMGASSNRPIYLQSPRQDDLNGTNKTQDVAEAKEIARILVSAEFREPALLTAMKQR